MAQELSVHFTKLPPTLSKKKKATGCLQVSIGEGRRGALLNGRLASLCGTKHLPASALRASVFVRKIRREGRGLGFRRRK